MAAKRKDPRQVVGNAGLYYACYELSMRGWNVLPPSKNARGVDVVVYSEDAKRVYTIQVKALSKRDNANLGSKENLIADYLVVVLLGCKEKPEVFIAKMTEVLAIDDNDRLRKYPDKRGHLALWLQPMGYGPFKDKWGDLETGTAGALSVVDPITR